MEMYRKCLYFCDFLEVDSIGLDKEFDVWGKVEVNVSHFFCSKKLRPFIRKNSLGGSTAGVGQPRKTFQEAIGSMHLELGREV